MRSTTAISAIVTLCLAAVSSSEATAGETAERIRLQVRQSKGQLELQVSAQYRRDILGEEWESLAALGRSWSQLPGSVSPEVAATSRSLSVLLPASTPDEINALRALPSIDIRRLPTRGVVAAFTVDIADGANNPQFNQRIAEALLVLVQAEQSNTNALRARIETPRRFSRGLRVFIESAR